MKTICTILLIVGIPLLASVFETTTVTLFETLSMSFYALVLIVVGGIGLMWDKEID